MIRYLIVTTIAIIVGTLYHKFIDPLLWADTNTGYAAAAAIAYIWAK